MNLQLLAEASRTTSRVENEQVSLSESVGQLNERLLSLQQDLRVKENELANKAGQQTKIEEEVNSLRTALEKERLLVEEKDTSVHKLQEDILQLRAQLLKAESEVDEKQQQIDQLVQKLNDVQQKIEQHGKEQNADLHDQLNELRTTLEKKLSLIAGLEESIAAKDNQMVKLDSDISLLKKELQKKTDGMHGLEKKVETLSKELEKANKAFEEKIEELQNVESTLQLFQEENKRASKPAQPDNRLLAVSDFKDQDLVCFVYISATGFYEAFNMDTPNYYLSEESLELFVDEKRRKQHIFGQVVYISPGISEAGANPYNLPVGTPYFMVTITRIERPPLS